MKTHTEGKVVCEWDKDHSGQKTYRDSAAVWVTVPAMAKLQAKLGVTDETMNQTKAFIAIGKMVGIDFAPEDFDRTKGAEQPKPKTAKADSSDPIAKWIFDRIKAGETEENIKGLLLSTGWTPEAMKPYFKQTSIPLPPK